MLAGWLNSAWEIAARTVGLGVTIYVAGQIVQRFFIEPIQEQRRTMGEIAAALLFLGNIGHVAQLTKDGAQILHPDEPVQASRTIRSLAARLHASLWTIPFYWGWATMRVVPSKERVREATGGLIQWSNSLYEGQPVAARERVAKALKLPLSG